MENSSWKDRDMYVEFVQMCAEFKAQHSEHLSDKKFMTMLYSLFEHYRSEEHDNDIPDSKFGDKRTMLSGESVNDFKAMWEHFVQSVIDYVNNHKDVADAIQTIKENNKETMGNAEHSFTYVPDLRVYFSADGLDSSVEHKEWVPATDSHCSLCVGETRLIDMC